MRISGSRGTSPLLYKYLQEDLSQAEVWGFRSNAHHLYEVSEYLYSILREERIISLVSF